MAIEFILRIFVAALLGGIIGLDREYRAKDAGFRTHFLVALGSSLFMVMSQYGFSDILTSNNVSLDPSRIASQVVTGIGFIGAGTIIFQKQMVRGLTTAAGLWVTSAIGLACGSGMYIIASIATILSLICLEAFNTLLKRFSARNVSVTFIADCKEHAKEVMEKMERKDIDIESYSMEKNRDHDYTVTITLRMRQHKYVTTLTGIMIRTEGITIKNIE